VRQLKLHHGRQRLNAGWVNREQRGRGGQRGCAAIQALHGRQRLDAGWVDRKQRRGVGGGGGLTERSLSSATNVDAEGADDPAVAAAAAGCVRLRKH
jgi:hypothetical protein